jgi:hypothetical protein
MTEQEWLTGSSDELHSIRMVNQLRLGSDRKLRLLGCAFCREVWTQLSPLGRRAVEIAEEFAEGFADSKTRITCEWRIRNSVGQSTPGHNAELMAALAISETGWYAAELTVGSGQVAAAREQQLIRDVFGNPYRSVAIDSRWFAWQNGTIRRIAHAIYDDLDFDRMPILADALEDAGCTDQGILNHCRSEEPHVKGCWIVDLILDKK